MICQCSCLTHWATFTALYSPVSGFFVHGKMAHQHFRVELAFHLPAGRDHHDLVPLFDKFVREVDHVPFDAADLKLGEDVDDFHGSHLFRIHLAAFSASLKPLIPSSGRPRK